jgi:hypothetical protein
MRTLLAGRWRKIFMTGTSGGCSTSEKEIMIED